MATVIVLGGCGAVGSVAIKTLAAQDVFSQIIIGDMNRQRGEKLMRTAILKSLISDFQKLFHHSRPGKHKKSFFAKRYCFSLRPCASAGKKIMENFTLCPLCSLWLLLSLKCVQK